MTVPMPGESHPWYADKPHILDWVEQRGAYADTQALHVLVPLTLRWTPEGNVRNYVRPVLTRYLCAGHAPWAGQPYHYEWWVGTDQYGRHVAGEARIIWE